MAMSAVSGGSEELTPEQREYASLLSEELRLLEAMPQVAPLTDNCLFDRGPNNQQQGAIVSLLCCKKAGNRKVQIDQKFNDLTDASACHTHLDAVRLLRAKIEKEHGSEVCLERCGGCSAAPPVHAPPCATDFFAKSRLQQAVMRTAELRDRRAKDQLHAAQEEVAAAADALAALKSREPKRARTTKPFASATSAVTGGMQAEEEESPGQVPWESWLLTEHRRQMSWIQARRQVTLDVEKPGRSELPRGKEGALDHWRRGLVGAVQDWAEGSTQDAVCLIVSLIERLQLRVRLPCPALCGSHVLMFPACGSHVPGSLWFSVGADRSLPPSCRCK